MVIASSGSASAEVVGTRYGELRSRSGADLRFTARDAEAIYDRWRVHGSPLPSEFHVLLVDPSLRQVETTIQELSKRIARCRADVALDLYFAGHGHLTGDLVLKDGTFSPGRFLDLQSRHTGRDGHQQAVGVFLDSCYSGAFLVRLAVDALHRSEHFCLDDGLAACLPDEQCFEDPLLGHGVFTYTHLHQGNADVNRQCFNRAILQNDAKAIAKGLQGLVAMMGNAPAFLTEGRQFSMTLTKGVIDVPGYTSVEIRECDDASRLSRALTQFKNSRI